MRSFTRKVLVLLFPVSVFGQARAVVSEVDMGLLAAYHTTLTNPSEFVLGEEYELGGYMHDVNNGGVIAFTCSYVRNGAFGSNIRLPQYNYNVGKFTTAKVRFGKLWEGNTFDIFANVGFGYLVGADYAEKTAVLDLLFVDAENAVGVFTIPIGLDIQWYGFDGSINAIGLKYEINGWNNYLGLGFTYLL